MTKRAETEWRRAMKFVHPTKKVAPTTAGSILRKTADIVEGARNTTHGSKRRQFQMNALLWTAYLQGSGRNITVSDDDVALMMALVKVSRAKSGTPIEDHFADMAGYAAIAGELACPPTKS